MASGPAVAASVLARRAVASDHLGDSPSPLSRLTPELLPDVLTFLSRSGTVDDRAGVRAEPLDTVATMSVLEGGEHLLANPVRGLRLCGEVEPPHGELRGETIQIVGPETLARLEPLLHDQLAVVLARLVVLVRRSPDGESCKSQDSS